jgi:hypothetical protein
MFLMVPLSQKAASIWILAQLSGARPERQPARYQKA